MVDHIGSTKAELGVEVVRCSCGWFYFADDFVEARKKFKEHLKSESIND